MTDEHQPSGRRIVSRQRFEAPEEPFIAVLGGTETYGPYVDRPFADGLAEMTGRTVTNMGCMQGGLSLIHDTLEMTNIASKADLTVLQILGAQNVSNRLYMVHTRRNDRFLRAAPALQRMYPELDFTDFNFTGHLISSLQRTSPEVFPRVRDELRMAWVQRMQKIIARIESDVVLLWLSSRTPEESAEGGDHAEPMFVTRTMVEEVLPRAAGLVEVVGTPTNHNLSDPVEMVRAAALPDQALHDRVAEELGRVIGPKSERRKSTTLKNVS